MTETQDTDVLYKALPQHFGQIVTYLSSGLELMKSVGSSQWGVVTVIHDQGDGLALYE